MIYLDYSATTPVDPEVLKAFTESASTFPGNPNSHHPLGIAASNEIARASDSILSILGLSSSTHEVIYTSGASEASNLAIKGIAHAYRNRGNHIISTRLEHSSVIAPLSSLQQEGFEIDFVDLDANGQVDLNHLFQLLRHDTILVSIASINSEIGIIQPLKEIHDLLLDYPNCFFHCDMTQSIGKKDHDYNLVDLFNFSAHKFYGIKGVGALIKRKELKLIPLIHGGHSTTIYRSGTPATELILSLEFALKKAIENYSKNRIQVETIYQYLLTKLQEFPHVSLNSNSYCIPHIVNFSIPGNEGLKMAETLANQGICVSTTTACASGNASSQSVLALTHDEGKASSSLRISLSHLTTIEEIDSLITQIKEWK